jgi:hypothetical protein
MGWHGTAAPGMSARAGGLASSSAAHDRWPERPASKEAAVVRAVGESLERAAADRPGAAAERNEDADGEERGRRRRGRARRATLGTSRGTRAQRTRVVRLPHQRPPFNRCTGNVYITYGRSKYLPILVVEESYNSRKWRRAEASCTASPRLHHKPEDSCTGRRQAHLLCRRSCRASPSPTVVVRRDSAGRSSQSASASASPRPGLSAIERTAAGRERRRPR